MQGFQCPPAPHLTRAGEPRAPVTSHTSHHPSCEACGCWQPSEPRLPCAALVLVVLWYLFLLNFMKLEFNPLSSLSRTLSRKVLSYPFQRPAVRRCHLAFLYHYLGSRCKYCIGWCCATSPLSSLTPFRILGSFNVTNSLNCSIAQAICFFLSHTNILGDLSKCLLKLQMSKIKCLFLIFASRSWTKKKKRESKNRVKSNVTS